MFKAERQPGSEDCVVVEQSKELARAFESLVEAASNTGPGEDVESSFNGGTACERLSRGRSEASSTIVPIECTPDGLSVNISCTFGAELSGRQVATQFVSVMVSSRVVKSSLGVSSKVWAATYSKEDFREST